MYCPTCHRNTSNKAELVKHMQKLCKCGAKLRQQIMFCNRVAAGSFLLKLLAEDYSGFSTSSQVLDILEFVEYMVRLPVLPIYF